MPMLSNEYISTWSVNSFCRLSLKVAVAEHFIKGKNMFLKEHTIKNWNMLIQRFCLIERTNNILGTQWPLEAGRSNLYVAVQECKRKPFVE